MTRRVALAGTPGTGKTTVAGLLAPRHSVIEVGELAMRLGWGHATARGVEVDLPGLAGALRERPRLFGAEVVVGHLAHLLPIRDAIILRCHPIELERRLRAARRGDRRSRAENVVAEAISVVTAEARTRRRTIFELDTTRISPASVARGVERWMRSGRSPGRGRVDWLGEPSVTEHLLEWTG